MVGIPFVFCYLEDLLIFSPDKETHEKHLRIVLQHLWDVGLSVNPHKSSFFRSSVEYLVHTILESGISPLPHHTTAVTDFPVPEDVQQLQPFISMANFYQSFLPLMADICRPLTDLFKKDVSFQWGPREQAMFSGYQPLPLPTVRTSTPDDRHL